MSYSINEIPLSDYGIIPGRIAGSNIALSGHLDLPARINKTHHDWTGDQGFEPYVKAAEIFHGGRSLKFSGYLVASTRELAYEQLADFYQDLRELTELATFETPYGNYEVYFKEGIDAEYLQQGWIRFTMELQEPVVTIPNALPLIAEPEEERPHIDGVSLEDFGMFISSLNNVLRRAKAKRGVFTAYETEGFQITPVTAGEFELSIIATGDTYEILKNRVEFLTAIISGAGLRRVFVDGFLRACFNIKGFTVDTIRVEGTYALCKIKLPMLTADAAQDAIGLNFLEDNNYNTIVSNLNEIILTI